MAVISFRIYKSTDGNGIVRYIVKRKKYFLWIPFLPYWENLKGYSGFGRHRSSYTLSFIKEKDAVDHIENKVISNIKSNKINYEFVTEKSYNI